MKTLLDILQGMGVSAAAGLRPFLPTLVVGGFATADVGVDFEGTPFAFLESPWFLLAITVALVVSVLLHARIESSAAGEAAIAGIGLGLIAQAGARSLITRTRVRLDADAAAALFLYVEAAAFMLAGLAILVPPVSLLALGFFVWLRAGARRREGEKYAGLRILR